MNEIDVRIVQIDARLERAALFEVEGAEGVVELVAHRRAVQAELLAPLPVLERLQKLLAG